jgi:hypothetical protein
MLEIGYQHVVVANDLRLLSRGVGEVLKGLKGP